MKIYMYILLYLFLVSCQTNTSNNLFREPIFTKNKELRATEINIAPFILNRATDMLVCNNYLFIEDFIQQKNIVKVFDMSEEKILCELCQKGKGPGELLMPNISMAYDKCKDEIQLYDTNIKKLISFNGSNPLDYKKSVKEFRCYKKKEPFRELFKISNFFLGWNSNNTSEKKKYIILDENLNVKGRIGNFINPLADVNDETWNDIVNYCTQIAISPDMTKLVIGTYIGGYMEIYDLDQLPKEIPLINSLLIYPPIYKHSKGKHKNIRWGDETTIGFEDIYTSDKYIYTLLNGCKGSNYTYPNGVSVFDYAGNPIVQYHLDRNICSLAVDEEKGIMYAVEMTEDRIELVKFTL